VVSEQNVRSDSKAVWIVALKKTSIGWPFSRTATAWSRGFASCGPRKSATVVLRDEAPYAVQTEGRFTGMDILGQRLIAAIGATGTSVVQRSQTGWEWTLIVRDPSALDATGEPSTGVSDLLDGLDHLKVFLVAGRFDAAEGFSLSKDGRVATFDYKESDGKSGNRDHTLAVWKRSHMKIEVMKTALGNQNPQLFNFM
jgi:hypothetical protein